MADTINKTLQSLFITHQNYIERYKTYEIKKIRVILKDAETELKKVIGQYADKLASELTISTQKQLLKQIQELQKIYNEEIVAVLTEDMHGLSVYEMQYYSDQVNNAFAALQVDLSTNLLTPEKLNALIDKTPVTFGDGSYFSVRDFVSAFTDKNIGTVTQVVRNGFLLNQPMSDISKTLFGLQGRYLRSYNDAASVARTLTMHYANTSRELFYKNNTDIIKGYQWCSTLDANTTAYCQDHDGKYWLYDSPEKSTLEGAVVPPGHYNCRSCTVPITRSWQELGIEGINELPVGTRASMTGYVPGKVTYKEWFNDLEKYTANAEKIRRDVLGPVRFDLWKKNNLKIESFYGNDGRWLSLKDLSKKDLEISEQYVRYFK